MTSISVADEIAADLMAKAVENRCTTDEMLRSMLFRLDLDEQFVERMSTPELGRRIVADLAEVDAGKFTTSEEVDKKFEALFAHLRAK